MKGYFITFEGTDGAGKSTQIRFLSERLQNAGYEVLITREPGGCEIAEKLRNIVLDAENEKLCALGELLIYEAARAQHVHEIIAPALETGKIVLCDRYIHSTLAYQGYARGIELKTVAMLNELAMQGAKPDLTLFLEIDETASFLRKGGVEKDDRMELQGNEFHHKVYEGFRKIVQDDPSVCRLAVGDFTKNETAEHIWHLVCKKLSICEKRGNK